MNTFTAQQLLPALQPWVLAAEDDENDFFCLRRAISKATKGILLIRAADGSQAMHFLQESLGQLPMLIITDLSMPGIDGFGLLAWVRANSQMEKVPVFVWTASEQPKDREKAKALAAHAYHPKGVTHSGLAGLMADFQSLLPLTAAL